MELQTKNQYIFDQLMNTRSDYDAIMETFKGDTPLTFLTLCQSLINRIDLPSDGTWPDTGKNRVTLIYMLMQRANEVVNYDVYQTPPYMRNGNVSKNDYRFSKIVPRTEVMKTLYEAWMSNSPDRFFRACRCAISGVNCADRTFIASWDRNRWLPLYYRLAVEIWTNWINNEIKSDWDLLPDVPKDDDETVSGFRRVKGRHPFAMLGLHPGQIITAYSRHGDLAGYYEVDATGQRLDSRPPLQGNELDITAYRVEPIDEYTAKTRFEAVQALIQRHAEAASENINDELDAARWTKAPKHDDMLDATRFQTLSLLKQFYPVPTLKLSAEGQPEQCSSLPEDIPMKQSLITKITYVNGTDVSDLPDEAIFDLMANLEKQAAALEGIDTASAKKDKRIKFLRKEATKLAKLVDAR